MGSPFDPAHFDKIWSQTHEYFFQHVLSWAMAAQIAIVGCALLLAYKATGGIRTWLPANKRNALHSRSSVADLTSIDNFRHRLLDTSLALFFVWIALRIAGPFQLAPGWPVHRWHYS